VRATGRTRNAGGAIGAVGSRLVLSPPSPSGEETFREHGERDPGDGAVRHGIQPLYGVTGMLSFGQAAYYGVGAYTVGCSSRRAGAFWVALPATMVAGGRSR